MSTRALSWTCPGCGWLVTSTHLPPPDCLERAERAEAAPTDALAERRDEIDLLVAERDLAQEERDDLAQHERDIAARIHTAVSLESVLRLPTGDYIDRAAVIDIIREEAGK